MLTDARDGVRGLDERTSNALLGAGGTGLFALLIWLSALVQVSVPPYGVPATFQTLAVALSVLALGPRLGLASVGVYLLAGMAGMGVFADAPNSLGMLTSQVSGYLLGFIPAQILIARIVRVRDSGGAVKLRSWWALPAGVFAGGVVIFACGVPGLWLSRNVWSSDPSRAITWAEAWHGGCVVFLPWEGAKLLAASVAGWWLVPFSIRRGW